MSGCAPPFLRSSLNNKAKIKLKNTEHSNMSTDSLPSDYFDQQLQNILVNTKYQPTNVTILEILKMKIRHFPEPLTHPQKSPFIKILNNDQR